MEAQLDRYVVAGAAALALLVPAWLLAERPGAAPAVALEAGVSRARAISPPSAPAEPLALARPLFRAPEAAAATVAKQGATGPELIGIVGRLPDEAVALVRAGDGRSRAVEIGQSFDGWRLASLSPDAALFVRGTEKVRASLDPES